MKTNANDSAYPSRKITGDYVDTLPSGGLTKLEYFAALAMQGLCADGEAPFFGIHKQAVIVADALIDELNKTKGSE